MFFCLRGVVSGNLDSLFVLQVLLFVILLVWLENIKKCPNSLLGRPQESQLLKRDANTAGGWGWGGGGGGKQDVKKVKVDLDDDVQVLSTSSTTDTKRAPIVQQQRYGSYNRNQANLAALARAAKFPCNKCGNKFDSKADLDKHESSEHDEGRCSKIILLLLAFLSKVWWMRGRFCLACPRPCVLLHHVPAEEAEGRHHPCFLDFFGSRLILLLFRQ